MSVGGAPLPRFGQVAVGVTAAGLLLTAAVTAARIERPGLGVLTLDDLHEGQLEVAAAIVLIFVAAVMAGRVRRQPTRRHLVLLAALCVLASANLVAALMTAGFDSLSASRFATWAAAVTGLLGPALLLVAVVVPDEPLARPRYANARTITACCVGLAVVLGALWLLRGQLPLAFDTLPTSPDDVTVLSQHPALVVAAGAACVCWVMAGCGLVSIARRTDDDLAAWMGLAALVAAVGYLNYTLFPSQLIELMFLGDYFYLAAVAILVVGAAREVGNSEAARVDSAVYAERRRIAAEMHDGVAQELAYISAQTRDMQLHAERRDRGLSKIADAAERALDESRAAIKELSGPVYESLAHAIEMTAVAVAGRDGAEVELQMDESLVVPPSTRVALVRITREAVGNAVRHGHAGRVRIDLWEHDGARLRITDDGTGIDPSSVDGTFGLSSIRERVANLAGELSVSSSPSGGTVLEVRVS